MHKDQQLGLHGEKIILYNYYYNNYYYDNYMNIYYI